MSAIFVINSLMATVSSLDSNKSGNASLDLLWMLIVAATPPIITYLLGVRSKVSIFPRELPSYEIEYKNSMELSKAVLQSAGDVRENLVYPIFLSTRRNVVALDLLYKCGMSQRGLAFKTNVFLFLAGATAVLYVGGFMGAIIFGTMKVSEVFTWFYLLLILLCLQLRQLSMQLAVFQGSFRVAQDIVVERELEFRSVCLEDFEEECRDRILDLVAGKYHTKKWRDKIDRRFAVSVLKAYGFGKRKDIRKRLQESDAANESHFTPSIAGGANIDHVSSCGENTREEETPRPSIELEEHL